ncbi:alpha/beta fold hydrolase [Planctomycetota bacterium]
MAVEYSLKGYREPAADGGKFWPACDYPGTEKSIVAAGGINFWVETEGEGEPLILIHGGPGIDHRCFHPHLSMLAECRRLIYYDLRGHYMSSEAPDNRYGPKIDAEDVEGLRIALGLEKIALFGYSYGSIVAHRYAEIYGENLSHIIVSSSPIGMTGEEMDAAGSDHPLTEKIQNAKTPDERRELFLKFYYHKPLHPQTRKYNDATYDAYPLPKNQRVLEGYEEDTDWPLDTPLGEMPHTSMPALYLYGRYDPLPLVDKLQKKISNLKNAACVIFQESGHDPFAEEPEKFAQVLRSFLEE